MSIRFNISVLLLLLFASLHGRSQEFDNLVFGTDSTFEIMTWNLEWFPKDGQTTIDYVVEIVEALEVDLIAVQEIGDTEAFYDVTDALAGYAGFAVNDDWSGLGYIYRTEVIEMIDVFEVFVGEGREFPRPPLVMHLFYEDELYTVINNHLKCCGDGILDVSDPWDEETRRRDACLMLDELIEDYFPQDRVVLVGDLNDILNDDAEDNVFLPFLNDSENYLFTDQEIANGDELYWSYPNWPSHLDHILISQEVFTEYDIDGGETETILIDNYINNGWVGYEEHVSDHRPVAMKIIPQSPPVDVEEFIEDSGFSMAPNPASTSDEIRLQFHEHADELLVFDALGRVVYSDVGLADGTTLYPAHWHAGLYVVRVRHGNTILCKKLLVN